MPQRKQALKRCTIVANNVFQLNKQVPRLNDNSAQLLKAA